MKRHDFDWTRLVNRYDDLFGKGSFIVSEDGVQAYVTSHEAVLAIFQKTSEDSALTLHLRSNLTPNAAAYVAMHGYMEEDLRIGENFSINPNSGDWAYGIEAMEYARDNPDATWAVTIELARLQKDLKKKEKDSDKEPVKFVKKDDGRILN
jgi:hypothetical protein